VIKICSSSENSDISCLTIGIKRLGEVDFYTELGGESTDIQWTKFSPFVYLFFTFDIWMFFVEHSLKLVNNFIFFLNMINFIKLVISCFIYSELRWKALMFYDLVFLDLSLAIYTIIPTFLTLSIQEMVSYILFFLMLYTAKKAGTRHKLFAFCL
jgi:hypothetical protein